MHVQVITVPAEFCEFLNISLFVCLSICVCLFVCLFS